MPSTKSLALAAAATAALALLASSSAQADKPFSVATLDGTYHFAVVEIAVTTDPAPETVYCNSYGRIAFDGAGWAEIDVSDSYGVCSNGESHVESQSFSYTVDSEGSLLLTEQGTGEYYTTHCQILDKGALLLCDGTGGIGGSSPEEQTLWMATAGKL